MFNLETHSTEEDSVILKGCRNGFSCSKFYESILGGIILLADSHIFHFPNTGEESDQLFRRHLRMDILYKDGPLYLFHFRWVSRMRYHGRWWNPGNGRPGCRHGEPGGKVAGGGKCCVSVDRLDEVLTFSFFRDFCPVERNDDESFIDEHSIGKMLGHATLLIVLIHNVTHFHLNCWYRLL